MQLTFAITGPPGNWHGIDETMTFHEQYEHEVRAAVGGSEFMALLWHRLDDGAILRIQGAVE